MPRMRFFLSSMCLAVAMATVGSGCINQDVGPALLVQPELLNFGIDTDRLVLEVSKNVSENTLEPIVATSPTDWITIEKCGDAAEDCISYGPALGVRIPVRIHRDRMRLGTNSSTIELFSGGTSLQFVTVIAEDRIEAEFQASRSQADPGQPITFRDQSLVVAGAGPITARHWDFGDGSTSTEVNPAHAYAAPGLYTVKLTVTTPSGTETRTKNAFIQVGEPQPEVDFTASDTAIAVDHTVTFTNTTLAGGVEILGRTWDFGDGFTSTEINPKHQYTKTGIFTVSLTVNTDFGAYTETKENLIVVRSKVAPIARFSISQPKPFVNVPVQFSDVSEAGSAPINTRFWDFGDGSVSTDTNPVHTFTTVGPQQVKLIVISDDGTGTVTETVEVIFKAPEADFLVDDENPSVFQELQFTDISRPGSLPVSQWFWDFGDGNFSVEQNPVHRYQLRGTYTVSLVATTATPTNNSDTEIKEEFIVVVSPPSPAFAYTVQDNITTSGQAVYTINDVQFTNQTVPGEETPITYRWDFDGDPGTTDDISTETNPTYRFTEAGTYNVTLTATTPTRSVSASQLIVVDQAPSVSYEPSTTMGNVGVRIDFTNTTVDGISGTMVNGGNVVTVDRQVWDFDDGISSFNVNANHVYENVGTYTPTLTIFFTHSGTGLPAQLSQIGPDISIDIAPPPTAAFSIVNTEGTACVNVGQSVNFVNESDPSVGTAPRYLWDFGDGSTSTLENPGHSYSAAGSYAVSLTITIEDEFAPRNIHSTTRYGAVQVGGLLSTALADYVNTPDPSFSFTVDNIQNVPFTVGGFLTSARVYSISMNSQTWRSTADYEVVNTGSATWEHNVALVVPQSVLHDTGMLFVSGGSNGSAPFNPADLDDEEQLVLQIAAATQSVVTLLEQVPNESIQFADEVGLRTRTEDGIIAYTFDEYMRSFNDGAEDPTWPLLLPMAKSAVRAMDVVQSFNSSGLYDVPVDNFVVSGASKRGWTTWLTAAADSRVTGIIPIVIDVLNMERQMEHHFNAYGYWAPSIYDYAQERIFDRFGSDPAADALTNIVDPFSYRCNLDMPKMLLNSTGDQFFLSDSSQWYFDQLQGEKYLNYVPNTDHGMSNSTDLNDTSSAAASLVTYYSSLLSGGTRPEFDWEFLRNGSIEVTAQTTPSRVLLWQASNPDARDFRLDQGVTWSSTTLASAGSNRWVASIPEPETGYAAFFVQLQFPNANAPFDVDLPFTFTTGIRVLPETEEATNLYPDFTGTRSSVGPNNSAVPVVTVHGEAGEMGEEYGRLMAPEINAFIPAFLAAAQAADPTMTNAALDNAWFNVIANTDPDYDGPISRFEAEVVGVAAGSGVDFDTLRRANMVPVLAQLSGSGSAALRNATTSGSLSANLFQSSTINWSEDLGLQDYPCIVIYIPARGDGLPHVNVTFAGLSGALSGMNIGGIVLSSVEIPDQPGDPTGLSLAGDHYTSFFREMLYDAVTVGEISDRLMPGQLFQRQDLIVGDGRNLGQVRKFEIQAPDSIFVESPDNDTVNDFYAPNVRDGILYSATDADDATAIFTILDDALGSINDDTMRDVNDATTATPPTILKVVYNADDEAELSATYSGRPEVTLDLQDYLP